MSRAYRIRVRGSVDRIVHVDDGVCTPLELLPILPRERMQDILAQELTKRGFSGKNGIFSQKRDDGITIEIDVEKGTVAARQEADVHIEVVRRRTSGALTRDQVRRGTEGRRQALQQEVDEDAELEAARQTEIHRKRTTALLEGKLRDLKKELDEIVNRVTADALKEKAKQMGEIEEIVEDQNTGSLTIKVRL